MIISNEGLAAVPGFKGSGIHCGIKQVKNPDLALIWSETECNAAGVFTKNRVVASSVTITRDKLLKRGKARAVIINSGNANVCTGPEGKKSSIAAIKAAAKALELAEADILIASTGKISEPLPIQNILRSLPDLASRLSVQGCDSAAEAIMTTDTFTKKITVKGKVGGNLITVGGIAKGSGMIHPDMATMLAFLGTDAAISAPNLRKVLKKSADLSFNSITIDTTSTNDMLLILANGTAENRPIATGSGEYEAFSKLVLTACQELAKLIVKDGEGATKFISIEVKGAKTAANAKKGAYAIAQSPLVKTAFFGEDPNWGRIMAAIGASGIPVVEVKISMTMNGLLFVKKGVGLGKENEKRAARILKEKELFLVVDLHLGNERARVLTTDLSHRYIDINASYRT